MNMILIEQMPENKTKDRRSRSWKMVRKHYHDRGWQSPYRKYEEMIRSYITEGAKVLDVGCGRHFPMGQHLLEMGAEVYGIDPVAEPKSAASGIRLQRAGADHIPFEEEMFDMIISRSVLEHLEKPVKVFCEFYRVLKPAGKVIFLAANRYDYVSLMASLLPNRVHGYVVNRTEGRDTEDTFTTYYRANSIRQISRLVQETGFYIESFSYLNQFPYTLMFSPILCRMAIAYDEWICKFSSLHFLKGWILGCLTKEKNKEM